MPSEIVSDAILKIQAGESLEQVIDEYRANGHTNEFLTALEVELVKYLNSQPDTATATPNQISWFWIKVIGVNLLFVVIVVAGYFYLPDFLKDNNALVQKEGGGGFCAIEYTDEVKVMLQKVAPLEEELNRLKSEYETMATTEQPADVAWADFINKEKEYDAVQDSLREIYPSLYKAELALLPEDYYQEIYTRYCEIAPTDVKYDEVKGQIADRGRKVGVSMSQLLCKLDSEGNKIEIGDHLRVFGGNMAYAGDEDGIGLIKCAAEIYLNPDAILDMAKINYSGAKAMFPALSGLGVTDVNLEKSLYYTSLLTILLGHNPGMMDDQSNSLFSLTALMDNLTNSNLSYTQNIKAAKLVDTYLVDRGVIAEPTIPEEINDYEYFISSNSLQNSRVEFELYYNKNQNSYEGGCGALYYDKYTNEPTYTNCHDEPEYYILSAKDLDGLWCIDSDGNKISNYQGDVYSGLNCRGSQFVVEKKSDEIAYGENEGDVYIKQNLTNMMAVAELKAAESGTYKNVCDGFAWVLGLRCSANDEGYFLEQAVSDGYYCVDSKLNSGVWPTPSPYGFSCSY